LTLQLKHRLTSPNKDPQSAKLRSFLLPFS
jgi:hypothetical protein